MNLATPVPLVGVGGDPGGMAGTHQGRAGARFPAPLLRQVAIIVAKIRSQWLETRLPVTILRAANRSARRTPQAARRPGPDSAERSPSCEQRQLEEVQFAERAGQGEDRGRCGGGGLEVASWAHMVGGQATRLPAALGPAS